MDLLARINHRLAKLRAGTPTPDPADQGAHPSRTDLEDALFRLDAEHNRQLALIHEAEEARERIVDDPDGDDVEILAIDRRIDLGRLALDRIERVEAEARYQLSHIRCEGPPSAAFYAQSLAVLDAMRRFEATASEASAAREALRRTVPGSVPGIPFLVALAPGRPPEPVTSDTFAAELVRCATSCGGLGQVRRSGEEAGHGR